MPKTKVKIIGHDISDNGNLLHIEVELMIPEKRRRQFPFTRSKGGQNAYNLKRIIRKLNRPDYRKLLLSEEESTIITPEYRISKCLMMLGIVRPTSPLGRPINPLVEPTNPLGKPTNILSQTKFISSTNHEIQSSAKRSYQKSKK